MRSLYDIEQDILACIDEETGEPDAEKLDALMMERNEKLEGVALWIKNLSAEVDMIKAEEDTLAARRKAKLKKIESLKEYLSSALNGTKFETAKCMVRFSHNKSVVVTDFTKISDDFLRYKEPEVNKKAVADAIKSGQIVDGCELVESVSITIK